MSMRVVPSDAGGRRSETRTSPQPIDASTGSGQSPHGTGYAHEGEQAEAASVGAARWALYICRACGLIFDEAKGDADSGVAPGTRFADIPDNWACPLCGVTKADFEPYEVVETRRERRMGNASPSRVGARGVAGTVIVGAGRAGWAMAEALRARDADMPILLVCSCDGAAYDKPLLSVALARGLKPEAIPKESGAQAAARLGIKLLANTQAVRITPASRQLRTSRGTLHYRHLVLAHGAQARLPAQWPAALCWRINHLQAYTAFRAALGSQSQRVAVVGAGLVGSELANDLALAGHRVTLLDIAARPLANCLSEVQSLQLLAAWEVLAIDFVGSVELARIEQINLDEGGPGKQITTRCGRSFQVDQIVLAAGLQTPSRLARSAGLAWDNGIAVEAGTLATNVSGIHALGDCISINGKVSRYIEPIGRQAQSIAARITGQSAVPYADTWVPLRLKTGSLPFTV